MPRRARAVLCRKDIDRLLAGQCVVVKLPGEQVDELELRSSGLVRRFTEGSVESLMEVFFGRKDDASRRI